MIACLGLDGNMVGPGTESCVTTPHTPMPIHGFIRCCRLLFLRFAGKTWTVEHPIYNTRFPHAHCMCKRGTAQSGTHGSGKQRICDSGAAPFLSSHCKPQDGCLRSIRFIKRRALAGGRIYCASELGFGGVRRTSRGAAGENQT